MLRKYGLLQLRRGTGCHLLFRWPKDSVRRNAEYYQGRYRQPGLPPALPHAQGSNFVRHLAVFQGGSEFSAL